MRKNNPLNQQVNFMLAVGLIGASALLGMVMMIEMSEADNPVAAVIAETVYAEGK